MRRALLTAARSSLPAIGEAFMGGFYAGIIDTTKGNIIVADASQTGAKYALIVSPKSLEHASKQWKTSGSDGPTGVRTRWDGLAATAAMAANAATYPAAGYCAGLSYPSDGASAWYLPALDELELVYRNLKATTESNLTGNRSAYTFPGVTEGHGANPSSSPAGAAYTASAPAQTSVAAFQGGGAQTLGVAGANNTHWTSTEHYSSNAWGQTQSGSISGAQVSNSKTSAGMVRPVRRLLL